MILLLPLLILKFASFTISHVATMTIDDTHGDELTASGKRIIIPFTSIFYLVNVASIRLAIQFRDFEK